MGLFSRFKRSEGEFHSVEQDALALIDKGNALEDNGLFKGALECYEAATHLAPKLARAHLNCGNALLEMGRTQNALAAYATALDYDPKYAAAHYNMGNAYLRSEQREAALASYKKALALKPEFVDAEVACGNTLKDLGRLREAIDSHRQVLKIKPDYVEVHNSLGLALHAIGQLNEAEASYRQALELAPDYVLALSNLGNVLQELGKLDDAVACYRKAIEIAPAFADAHINLGNVLGAIGRHEDALDSYRLALEINPGRAEAHGNLGNVLKNISRHAAAVVSLQRAIEIDPDYAEAHNTLGNALLELGQFPGAVASYRQALKIEPSFAEAHSNLGHALQQLGMFDKSVESCRRALTLKPVYAEAYSNLGNALKDLSRLDEALLSYQQALKINPASFVVRSNLLFASSYCSDCSPARYLAEAVNYGSRARGAAQPYDAWSNTPDAPRRLRIGFVSGDFRQHPVGNFIEAVLATLSTNASSRLEIFAYPCHSQPDDVTTRIKAHCHGWHSAVGLSDKALAERIREDGIDILIDLSGHTAHNRLPVFAWKPAPVQATWLGYLATTGVAAIDYVLADDWTLPESEEANFTEKVWRLPESYLCFTPPAENIEVGPLPAIRNGYVTFGSFNNLTKMNDTVVALWSRILTAVPTSRLYLKSPQLKETSIRQSVAERFIAHGIAAERLILEGPVPRADYLKPFQRVDIALDPFPYPGITTSVETLWMGVPLLSLAGQSFLSRQGVGLLMNAGLPEWIAEDADDYVARAVSHATDLRSLATLRKELRQRVMTSPIFDAPRFAQHFEEALRGMWRNWCLQQKGESTQP